MNSVQTTKVRYISKTVSPGKKISTFFQLIRVHHWVKNLLIFVPAFFAGIFFESSVVINLVAVFFSFSIISSGIYVLNDINDYNLDSQHPLKKNRALPAGKISLILAKKLSTILIVTGLIWAGLIHINFLGIAIIYITINILYSRYLKKVALLDILCVSSGFYLRIIAGSLVLSIPLSPWLLFLVGLVTMLLIIGKRRDDALLFSKNKLAAIPLYKNIALLNFALIILTILVSISYLAYTIYSDTFASIQNPLKYFGAGLIVFGSGRYVLAQLRHNENGDPIKAIYSDKYLITTLGLWLLVSLYLLYS